MSAYYGVRLIQVNHIISVGNTVQSLLSITALVKPHPLYHLMSSTFMIIYRQPLHLTCVQKKNIFHNEKKNKTRNNVTFSENVSIPACISFKYLILALFCKYEILGNLKIPANALKIPKSRQIKYSKILDFLRK